MNKRLENKITKEYDESVSTRVWLAKHWHRWITHGCSMCWEDTCNCSAQMRSINSPKGLAEMAEYAYNNYGEAFRG